MMGFNLDMKELLEYSRNLAKSSDNFEDFLKDFLIEMANRIIAKTKPRTPVDTGALRGAWKLGHFVFNKNDIGVEILNPMEYATEIEYGHRIVRNGVEVGWYEGKFMLRTSIDEVKRQMPLRNKMNFENWCKRNGIA
jgi:hypothetical protein